MRRRGLSLHASCAGEAYLFTPHASARPIFVAGDTGQTAGIGAIEPRDASRAQVRIQLCRLR